MVQKDQEFNAQTRKKQGRYDKRLILKIVSDIESGHPRKELQDQYGLGKRSIYRWMKITDQFTTRTISSGKAIRSSKNVLL
ncbi:MAG: hypothetical protein IPH98_05570 [Saprospiraceae bacterium]|nr:hypothetical protein [Candidatus Defluviibacterium haderslevense]